MNPVLLVASLTQQIAEQEKRAEACSEDAENKAALSKNLLRRGNLLMQMGDKEGAGMHVYKGEKPREEKEKRKERELVNVAHDIFGRQTRITYIDLCEQLQQVLDIKERTAKSYIRFMRERDIITKDTANQSCFVIGSYHLQRNASCP